jgi:putative ABC transport system permease protein
MFRDLLAETFLSLTTHKARSFLTVLGIVIGISSVIVMVSIGQGTKTSIESSIESIGSNLLMVSPGGESRGQIGGGGMGANTDSLTTEDAQALRGVRDVAAVAPVIAGQYQVSADASNTNVSVTGTSADYTMVRNIEMKSGDWFTAEQDSAGARVAVLGPTTAETLFGTQEEAMGRRMRISGQPFTVIGITTSKGGSGFNNADEAVYIPLQAIRRNLAGLSAGISTIYLTADTQEAMTQVETDVTDLLLSRHRISDTADADFQVQSQQDLADTVSSITTMLTLLLGSIAGISLLVGGIGIMNMMLTSVTERIREIGLRKAVGATAGDVTLQFLSEAVALTLIGGVVGIALGWGVSAAISAFSTLTTTVSPLSVVLAAGVSTVIGVVFGFYPARRAAKLDPIESLRYQ